MIDRGQHGQMSSAMKKTPRRKAKQSPEAIEFGERAWRAWHSLPRDENGEPPSQRSIEKRHDLPQGTLSKVFKGDRANLQADTLEQLAEALGTSPAWLLRGHGEPPRLTGPIGPRPGELRAVSDPADRYPNRASAIAMLRYEVDPRAVESVRAMAAANDHDMPVTSWCELLIEENKRAQRGIKPA